MVEVSARGTGLKKVTTKLVMRHAHHPGTDPEEVTVLDLSNNEVSHVGESFGDSFPLVMELSLARNALFGLDARNLPVQLTRLSLAHNKLESVAFLSALPSLVDLDLSYNLLRSLDGVGRDGGPPARLRRLSVRGNRVRRVDGVARLVSLEVLDLGDNDLRTEDDLRPLSMVDAKLRYLVLEGNPLHGSNPAGGLGASRAPTGTASVKFHVMNLLPSLYMLDGRQLGVGVASAGTRATGSYASKSAAKARHQSQRRDVSPGPSPRAPASAPRPQHSRHHAPHHTTGRPTHDHDGMHSAQSAPAQPRRPGGYPVAEIGNTALRRRPRPPARQPVLTRGSAKPNGNGLWSSPPRSISRPRTASAQRAPHTQPPLQAEASFGRETPRRHLPFDTPMVASTAPPVNGRGRAPRSAAHGESHSSMFGEEDPFAHAYDPSEGAPPGEDALMYRPSSARHYGEPRHVHEAHEEPRQYRPPPSFSREMEHRGDLHPPPRRSSYAEEAGFSGRGGYGGDDGDSEYQSLLHEADNVAAALLEEKRRLLEEHVRQDQINDSTERAQRASPRDEGASLHVYEGRGGSPQGLSELARRHDAKAEAALRRAGMHPSEAHWAVAEDRHRGGPDRRLPRKVGENLSDAFALILSQNWAGGTAPPSVALPKARSPPQQHAPPPSRSHLPAPGFIRDEFRRNLARARRGLG